MKLPGITICHFFKDDTEYPTDSEYDKVVNHMQSHFHFPFYRGLVPHCLSVLKTCKYLTEQLVGMTMGNSQTIQTQELLTEVVTVAKRISPRVDEVVVAMYPPLDPRLLEARFVH